MVVQSFYSAPCARDDGFEAPAARGLGVGKHVVGHAVGRNHAGLVRDAELLENLHCVLHGVPVAAGAHDHTDLDGCHSVRGKAPCWAACRECEPVILLFAARCLKGAIAT